MFPVGLLIGSFLGIDLCWISFSPDKLVGLDRLMWTLLMLMAWLSKTNEGLWRSTLFRLGDNSCWLSKSAFHCLWSLLAISVPSLKTRFPCLAKYWMVVQSNFWNQAGAPARRVNIRGAATGAEFVVLFVSSRGALVARLNSAGRVSGNSVLGSSTTIGVLVGVAGRSTLRLFSQLFLCVAFCWPLEWSELCRLFGPGPEFFYLAFVLHWDLSLIFNFISMVPASLQHRE